MLFRLLPILVLLLFVAGCSKKSGIEPTLAAKVTGTYNVTRWLINGGPVKLHDPNDPRGLQGITITYKLDPVVNESSQVETTYIMQMAGSQLDKKIWKWSLIQNGNDIDAWLLNSKVGTINGSTLGVKFVYVDDGITVEMTATKQ